MRRKELRAFGLINQPPKSKGNSRPRSDGDKPVHWAYELSMVIPGTPVVEGQKTEPSLILVVDDYVDNHILARFVLERDGYRVDVAGSSAEAQQRLDVRLPDLILMDIQLSGEDGLTLTRRLKADPATAGIRIVALTALAMPGDEAQALAAGCEGHITKPINTRTFAAQVRRYLEP
jgi:two-component system cell cycle response regulator DivK